MKRTIKYLLILYLTTCCFFQVLGKDFTFRFHRPSVSGKNLLKSSLYRWEQGQFILNRSSNGTVPTDTISIMAILVEFQPDDDERTTGNGLFDLSISPNAAIDPPPHDRDYFQTQLEALSNYYFSVSNGNLLIKAFVFDSVFSLPNRMAYYNPATTEEELDRGLAELFRDAVKLADSAGVKFSEYDCLIIFHAGVGRDIDVGYDPTPCDIPSAFLNLKDLKKQFGDDDPDYMGINVEEGEYFIQEGIILPETESQEGIEIAMLGTMTLMFGFQLGLPALWDTETGRSGIGRWGLMDQGSGNFYGLIPAEPCGWSKVFLGWETPIDTVFGDSLKVGCSKTVESSKIYRIPINDHEYFLIENRIHDFNGDGVAIGWDKVGHKIIFKPDGTVEAEENFGVIVRVDEYDYGLPGSGVLIWHIDERVIEENYSENKVNVNEYKRGVDLEEADGAQDIGQGYGFTHPGAGSETGVMHDAWYRENEIHMLANNSDVVSFTPDTHPNTRSNSGGNSHIVIYDFSSIDTVMSFSIRNDLIQKGFPQDFGLGLVPHPPIFGDLDGDGYNEIIISTEQGKIFVWTKDGEPLVENGGEGYRVSVSGDTTYFPVALFIDAGREISESIVADFDGDSKDEIISGTSDGHLLAWEYNGSGPEEVFDLSDFDGAVTALLFYGGFVVGTDGGTIFYLSADYRKLWQRNLNQGGISGICVYSGDSFIITTDKEYIIRVDTGGEVLDKRFLNGMGVLSRPASFWSNDTTGESVVAVAGSGSLMIFKEDFNSGMKFGEHYLPDEIGPPVIGDFDGDGFIEIAVCGGGRIWCFNHNGSLADYFPVPWHNRDISLSYPLIADVDGSGFADALSVASNGNIEAYGLDGMEVEGFPLTGGGSGSVVPLLTDLDCDGDTELAVVSDNGTLFVWDLAVEYKPESILWGSFLHDCAHTGMNVEALVRKEPKDCIMVSRLVYNYPNPTNGNSTTIRYRLEKKARVTVTIVDLSGELIDRFSGPGQPQTENEVEWNLSGVESGVYFCEVRAEAGGKEEIAIIKIAVIK